MTDESSPAAWSGGVVLPLCWVRGVGNRDEGTVNAWVHWWTSGRAAAIVYDLMVAGKEVLPPLDLLHPS